MKGTIKEKYRVLPGPEGILPPAAASMGVFPPDPGMVLSKEKLFRKKK